MSSDEQEHYDREFEAIVAFGIVWPALLWQMQEAIRIRPYLDLGKGPWDE